MQCVPDGRHQVEFGPFPFEDQTALLICSDGLYKVLDDDALYRIYLQSSGPREAAQALVDTAFGDGSDDNISAAIWEYGDLPRTALEGARPIGFGSPAEEEDALAPMASAGVVTTPSEIKTGPVIGVLVIVAVLLAIFVF